MESFGDRKIVTLCLRGDRPAWNEFFRRFLPDILSGIRDGLRTAKVPHLAKDEDVLWGIHEKIVKRLYQDGILRQCRDTQGIRGWLREVGSNQAIDWAKARGRNKRLPEADARGKTGSLSSPLGPDSDLTVEDLLPTPDASEQERVSALRAFLETTLDQLDRTPNRRIRWTMRLCIMSVLPFEPDELSELLAFSGLPAAEFARRFKKMTRELERKEDQADLALGRAFIVHHEKLRLQRWVAEAERNPLADTSRIVKWREEIRKKDRLATEYLDSALSVRKPAHAEIAALVGLPVSKVDQVATALHRGRKILLGKKADAVVPVTGAENE